MTKIDAAITDNDNKFIESIDARTSIADNNVDVDADTVPVEVRSLLLEFLPRDLLQSILARYLDGNSLSNFWCASMSKKEMVPHRSSPNGKIRSIRSSLPMAKEILQIIQRRRALLTEEDNFENNNNNNNNNNNTKDDKQRYCLRRQVFHAFEEAISIQLPLDSTSEGPQDKLKGNVDDPSFNFKGFLRFSRRIFGDLLAMNYCETVPHNLLWSGFLRIHDTQLGGMNASEPIKVALVVHPRRWSMKEIRLWRNATTSVVEERRNSQPTFKANVIPHNFLPVGPNRGRLVGLTKSDQKSLRDISDRLNQSELVGRFSCMIASAATKEAVTTVSGSTPTAVGISHRNTDQPRGGQFTVKLMGFAQAQNKLNTVFREKEPGGIPLSDEKENMVLHSVGGANYNSNNNDHIAINDDRNSLLCCWNHEFLWEDSRSFRIETSHALRDTMKDYNRIIQ